MGVVGTVGVMDINGDLIRMAVIYPVALALLGAAVGAVVGWVQCSIMLRRGRGGEDGTYKP